MHLAANTGAGTGTALADTTDRVHGSGKARDRPARVLACMMLLVPAVGVPSELMLQDTLKSAIVAFGVLSAAMVFFWQRRGSSAPILWHGMVCLPLTLMLYALASMVWSHPYLAAVEAVRWFVVSLLLWLGLNTLTRENMDTLVWGIHGGAVVASFWAALQFWFDLGLFPQAASPASTFVNRNFFAEYAVCALPFSVWLLASLRSSRWLPWVTLTLALNVVAIMMTGTRSALIALLALTPVFGLILTRYRRQFAFARWRTVDQALVGLILAAGLLGLGLVPSGHADINQQASGTNALQRSYLRVASVAAKQEYSAGSLTVRAGLWIATARMALANPVAGVGAGAWEAQIPLYQGANNGLETDYYAHNEFLQLLAEYGAVAGGLFLAFLWSYLLLALGRTMRLQGPQREEAPVRAFTLASLLALMVVSSVGLPWHLAGTGAQFALCLAILAGSDTRLGVREIFFARPIHWRPRFTRVALALVLCCTVSAAYITQLAMRSEYKIVRAIQLARAVASKGSSDAARTARDKHELLQNMREAIDINPHYRKLTPIVAELLAASGDWRDAVWIWESVAASRPHIANLWASIALAHLQLGQGERAVDALRQLQRLQPDSPRTWGIEVLVLSRTGRAAQAAHMLGNYFRQGRFDYDMVQIGYALGLETRNWPLAILALELRNRAWPAQAADGNFRLGTIYADPQVNDDARALAAFRAGLLAVPPEQKDDFRNQVPQRYRNLLQ